MKARFYEMNIRTVGKLLTWRVIMIIWYIGLGYYTTGSFSFGLGLAAFTTVMNSIIYYLHERVWNMFDAGKKVNESSVA